MVVVGNREAGTKDWLGDEVEAGKVRIHQSEECLSNHAKHIKQGILGELHFERLLWFGVKKKLERENLEVGDKLRG